MRIGYVYVAGGRMWKEVVKEMSFTVLRWVANCANPSNQSQSYCKVVGLGLPATCTSAL